MTGVIRSFYFYKPFFIGEKFMQNFEHNKDVFLFYGYAQKSYLQNITVLKAIHID